MSDRDAAATPAPFRVSGLASLAARADPAAQRMALAAFLSLFTLVWTLYATISRANLDVHGDMAENVAWSRHLAFGYFKHPPLFAWIVGIWFRIFPSSDWAYFLLSATNAAVALAGVWALLGLFDRSPRRLAAVLALSLTPFFTFSAIKFNANTVLLAIWPWLAWAVLGAVRERSVPLAILAGLLAAMAVLGKYVSVVILATLFLATFSIPGWRSFYTSRAVPLMIVVFVLAMAPHLWWLQASGYQSLQYIDSNKAEDLARLIRSSASFTAAQALWLAPMVIALLVVTRRFWPGVRSAMRWRGATADQRLRLVLALGPFVLMLIAAWSTFTRLSAPWGIPLWFAVSAWLIYAPAFAEADIDVPRLMRLSLAVLAVVLLIAPIVRFVELHWGAPANAEPRREAAELLNDLWRKRTSTPLANVAGSAPFAASATFYAPDRPSEWVRFDSRIAPWMTAERLRRGGLGVICVASDRECLALASKVVDARAERIAVTLAKTSWAGRAPASDLVFIIQPPRP
jgi:4-amino-4-deoxy-L-arabinose transferase-like glycosyltransferase